MTAMLPYSRQSINQSDIEAVVEVLRSDLITQGPVVSIFERAVSQRVGAEYATASNSGTGALHIACLALGLGPGDRLWTVPNSFVSSANCGLHCGADVDFVDIDRRTWNISVTHLEEKLFLARKTGVLPKVIVPVHFAGLATEQETIWELAQEFGCKVLEDASHSLGAFRQGEPVGSCKWSDITVFSFHPVKIITTGEGGMALTNDKQLAERMSMFRAHGITRDEKQLRKKSEGLWYYEQQLLGFNYRMTDIQAALGYSQLDRLETFVKKRRAHASRYFDLLSSLPLQLQEELPEYKSSWHLFVVRVKRDNRPKMSRRDLFGELRAKGVGVNVHYIPIHLHPYYRKLGFTPGQCPEAEKHGEEAITLPLYPNMDKSDQDKVVGLLEQFF
jgi:UDP-4-amino-4,6-dideoxy-N-acetyl-beta-L-altrosamine transaminase